MIPTVPQIEMIIEKANLSPTPDNCQPWEFEWNGETLSVLHLPERSKHPLNPGQLASILTLGCLIESIELAASELGLKSVSEIGPFDDGVRSRWAVVRFLETNVQADPLAKALSQRTTDRRIYKGGSEILDSLVLPSKNAGAQADKITKFSDDLIDYVVKTELFLPNHPTVLPGIMKWVRFSRKEARESGDGLSWRNMLARTWEVPSMWIMQNFPWTAPLFRPAVRVSHGSRSKEQLLSSAGAICISIKLVDEKIERSDLVDAGRLMLRTWLKVNQSGFGVQPLSLSTLPLIYRVTGNADDFFKQQSDLLVQGEDILRREFSISRDRLPVWMMRTGLSSPLPEKMRTFRKPARSKLTLLNK